LVEGRPLDEQLLERALRFIDYRPRSVGETCASIRKWGYSEAEAVGITEYLVECGILDDRAYSAAFMEELISKGYGYFRVRSNLVKRRIPSELIEETMKEYPEETEDERAAKAATRRFTPETEKPPEYDRVYGFLIRRGFRSEAAASTAALLSQFDSG